MAKIWKINSTYFNFKLLVMRVTHKKKRPDVSRDALYVLK